MPIDSFLPDNEFQWTAQASNHRIFRELHGIKMYRIISTYQILCDSNIGKGFLSAGNAQKYVHDALNFVYKSRVKTNREKRGHVSV